MPRPELTLQARYVFPVDAAPIPSGRVRIVGERIGFVGPSDRQPDLDFGNAAIVPGFVNAHTHLELSNVRAKSVAAGTFTQWLARVIEARRRQTVGELERAIERGIDDSLASGTTLVGDISSGGQSWRPLIRSPLRAVVFHELIGLLPQRALQRAQAARRWLTETACGSAAPAQPASTGAALCLEDGTALEPLPVPGRGSRRLVASLSPHAPYSTHPRLYDLAAEWARRAAAPLCSHLAETPEELQLLRERAGPLRGFLHSIGAWSDAWQVAGVSPLDCISSSATRDAAWLIAHGNYLTAEDIAILCDAAANGRARSVVYCPRTHRYFAHPAHPFRQMLAAGLNVCLGTDSLASSPTLCVLDEARFLLRCDAGIAPAVLLHMATLAGARALGVDEQCGSLTVGKLADLAVIRLPDRDEADPHRLLLDSDQPVSAALIGGQFAFQRRG
jgi:cytosine/adenosine deaminase-related metal-dependent hydrolase